MDSSLYRDLNPELKEVRLFQFKPAASYEDELVGNLTTVSLLDNPQIQTLSYICGRVDKLKGMRLSHPDTLGGPTVYSSGESRGALPGVRHTSDIYDVALGVLVYIDSGSDTFPEEHKHVLNVVETISTLGRPHRDEHSSGSMDLKGTWSALLRFCKNSYWFRMWTTQELNLAQKATFYYDQHVIPSEIVDAFYVWYTNHMKYGMCCRGDDHSTLLDSTIDIAKRAFATTRENQTAKREGNVLSLLDLLASVRHRLTTVLHDKVSALAGLAAIPHGVLDYKATAEVAFERIVAHLIESTGTPDVFNHLSTNVDRLLEACHLRNHLPETNAMTTTVCRSWHPGVQTGQLPREPWPLRTNTTSPKLLVPGVRCGVIAQVGECDERPLIFHANLIEALGKSAGVDIDAPRLSNGDLTSAKLRFIVALAGGIGVTSDGAFFLMKSREDYLRNKYLFTYWWQLEMREAGEFTVYCPRDLVDIVKYYDEKYMESFAARYEYLVRRSCILQRFVVLEDGKFGFAPPIALVGDLVCVLAGGRTPFVLGSGKRVWTSRARRFKPCTSVQRSEPTPAEDGCFQLVGDAYVEGLMDSSMLTDATKMEDFVLV
ncbi:hypothetical protein AYL99_07590 [Fonsecaea erecta]|uniref:Heterokaryon incompatibility domain-containing protein n=1 Tax=Fonsecaea erecta TaxID=1367422 RepID=A0A178ZFD2_9EURO|nr:hypothetical protein AYL99_07590 [Fonsecaea erecta]OAP58500.1 hypothetical protein AYL99_07590 [Fonsecaea erecta]